MFTTDNALFYSSDTLYVKRDIFGWLRTSTLHTLLVGTNFLIESQTKQALLVVNRLILIQI